MTHQAPEGRTYGLERSESELRRLVLQDELVAPFTRDLFERAGISEGMRVLDVGSGSGGVASLTAGLVGPEGSVVGVEIDPASVEFARDRAHAEGLAHVRFHLGDIATADLDGPFDAVVGRLVLMHLPDVVGTLVRIQAMLRPGGIIAFLEAHLASRWLSYPPSPTLEQVERVRAESGSRVEVDRHMGLELRSAFMQAGLPQPVLSAEALIGGGDGWPGYQYIEQTLRSLKPVWTKVGVEGIGEIVVDGMAERIEREVGDEGTVILQPFVGAWAGTKCPNHLGPVRSVF